MAGASIDFFGDQSIKDALIVVAFPTTGLVGSIAGQFLVDHLSLPLVGSITIDEIGPVATITDGLASGPIRIFGGEVECNLEDRSCPSVYLVTTDLQFSDPVFDLVGRALLEWATAGNANMLLCLEGVIRDEQDPDADVFAAGGDHAALQQLLTGPVKPLERALLGGISAVLLTRARAAKACTGAFVVEADPENPDGRAAVALIQALDRMIPSVSVDTKPLEKEAIELEQMVRRSQQEAKARTRQGTTSGAFI